MPKIAHTDKEILECFDVMSELRPHLKQEDFLETIKIQQKESYNLLYIQENHEVVAVAGFRIINNLFSGKIIYVDDLVTSSQVRSHGHGKKLLDYLYNLAKEKNYKKVELDSGVQRFKAHKFYLTNGFDIVSHHFSKDVI